ncbi:MULTISPECIES: DUF2142 domain-containing protein [Protofrankia]|uniref:DUF2142 domain-containing protein n=1 Tax=Candidatus Protofrankia datiscae TaxID=2716812 RepID=F8B678_9ACTN|nr:MULTISPECIES: DUF2142 domain-containing protein [Protofrankia]AEH08048.1 Protein of unknown function DUF2142, membrane [Candidatus Protofrankia datiscae]
MKRPLWSWPWKLGAPALLLAALTGWIFLWTLTNPLGTAPDEPSHYAKAVAAGHGQVLGEPVPLARLRSFGVFSEDSLRQVRNAYRGFELPPELRITTNPPCAALQATVSAACLRQPLAVPPGRAESIVGAYPPLVYISEGVLTRAAWSVRSGYVFARFGSALISAALLAAATWLLLGDQGRPGRRPLVLAGTAVAVTPMVIFLGSQVGASGTELTGALACAAAALRLSREEQPPARVWWVAGVVMGVTALSRPMAPLWIVLAAALGVGRLSPRTAWHRLRGGGRPAAAAAAIVMLGLAGSVLWTQALSLRTPVLWGRLGHGLVIATETAAESMRQTIGVFGWQSVPLPTALYGLWTLLAGGLFLAAFVVGRWRDRALLAGGLLVVVVLYELLAAAVFIQNGFGMQGRYILPALVMLPLLSVEVLADRLPARLSARAAVAAAGVIAVSGAGQFAAWLTNSHRYAVGPDGPLWFFLRHPAWSPPGGWAPWTVLACVPMIAAFATARAAHRDAVAAAAPAVGPGSSPDPDSFQRDYIPLRTWHTRPTRR